MAVGEGRYQRRQIVHLSWVVLGFGIRLLSDDARPGAAGYLDGIVGVKNSDEGGITLLVGQFSKAGMGIFWLAPKNLGAWQK
jgi:hypothetical protein